MLSTETLFEFLKRLIGNVQHTIQLIFQTFLISRAMFIDCGLYV